MFELERSLGKYKDVYTTMPDLSVNWRFETDECYCDRDKIGLLTCLIDCYIDLALIICDSENQVLWANDYAISVADKWGIFKVVEGELILTDENLRNFLSIDNDILNPQPVHKYFTSGHLFFDASRTISPENFAQTPLIGLAIDCRALKDCSTGSLKELSPAEYRLIKCLGSHHSLKESAGELHISYENARTKLKRIFDKLDVHSQRELLAKVSHTFDQSEITQ